MNIAIAAPQVPSSRHPFTGVYVVEQAQALFRHGHNVALLCARQNAEGRRNFALQESSIGQEALPLIEIEYPIIRRGSYAPCVVAFMHGLRRVERYFKPDLIHAHVALPVGFAAVVCGKMLGIPVAVTEHWGPVRDICKTRLSTLAMRFTASRADAMIAVSEHLKREIVSELRLKRKVNVIPNLYDPAKFYRASNNGSQKQSIDILFTGRRGDSRKGNDLVLRAFATALHRSSTSMRLVLVGSGLEDELAPLAAELGVASDCLFMDAMPIDQLSTLMRDCAFLVVASRYETFSLVIVEAMACGKPVVATRCGGPEELVTPQTGLLVPADNDESLAEAMIEMSRTLSQYDDSVIAGYACENFSEDIVARRLTRTYETMLGRV